MSGTPGRSGGARPGAGRKPKRELYAAHIAGTEDRIAGDLAAHIQTLTQLANRGRHQVEVTLQPAGLAHRDVEEEVLDSEGNPTGKVRWRRVSAFPDLPPDQLVIISRRETDLGPDRNAVTYLLNRI